MNGIAVSRPLGHVWLPAAIFSLVFAAFDPGVGFAQSLDAARWRNWQDNTGKYRVFAQLDSIDNQGVTLVLNDGRLVAVAWRRLSPADTAWVASYQARLVDAAKEVVKPEASRDATAPIIEGQDGPRSLNTDPSSSRQPLLERVADSPEAVSAEPGPEPTIADGLPAGNSIPAPTFDPVPPPRLALPVRGGNSIGEVDVWQPPGEPIPGEHDGRPDSAKADSLPADNPGSESSPNSPFGVPSDASLEGSEIVPETTLPKHGAEQAPDASLPLGHDLEPGREIRADGGPPAVVASAIPPALQPPALFSKEESSRPSSPLPEGVLVLPESSQALPANGAVPALNVAQKPGSTSTLSPVLRISLDGYLDQISNAPSGADLRDLLIRISQFPIPVDDPRTLEALGRCLTSGDKFVRESAFQMMILLSSRIETPILRDMLLDQSQSIRWKAYNVLIGEPRDELLDLVVGGMPARDRNKIVGVLRAYGTRAEKPVHPLLKSLQPEVRIEIAQLLGEIGTAASLPPLKAMADDETLPLVERLQAKAAIGRIESRKQ